jgi:hypothetical protein
VRLTPFRFPRLISSGGPPPGSRPLTRKEFYDLAEYCHTYALELARFEQTRVNLAHCYQFNDWLTDIRAYDRLAAPLATLTPARPIARRQILILAGVLAVILLLALPTRFDRNVAVGVFYSFVIGMIIFYFVPERLYGTTVELIEAKVLRVVDVLEDLLTTDDLGFTEAAYFRVKENLEAARRELRQQIDLAHRRWN